MNISLEMVTIGVSIVAILIGIASLILSILAYRKSNIYKELEIMYKEREIYDKHLDRKSANKSRLKTYGGSSGWDGEILKFKNMDNTIKMIDIEFNIDDGLNPRAIPHVYKNKIVEKGEELMLNYPRGNYQGNMDEINVDITFYFTDSINTSYKQRYKRFHKKTTFDEEPIEEKRDWEKLISKS